MAVTDPPPAAVVPEALVPAFIVKVFPDGTVRISNSALKSIPSTTLVEDPLSNVTKAPTSAL